mmetsp:Transcript_12280/g.25041  ORF Transcript_12280/g.25041 Transcript_12280/m.25041 type:complete len:192 (+) Transcript_12280:99-674(+)
MYHLIGFVPFCFVSACCVVLCCGCTTIQLYSIDIYHRYILSIVGHNLGLAHSGNRETAYGDQQGWMGSSNSRDDMRICFNPAKNYQLGWYDDRVKTIDPLGVGGSGSGVATQTFFLNGVADYNSNDDDDDDDNDDGLSLMRWLLPSNRGSCSSRSRMLPCCRDVSTSHAPASASRNHQCEVVVAAVVVVAV